MRTLAIDLGTRRIGLALSDEGGAWATPLDVLTVTDAAQAVAPIAAVIRREDVRRLVVGLPLNMDGTAGPAARAAVRWAAGLAAACQSAADASASPPLRGGSGDAGVNLPPRPDAPPGRGEPPQSEGLTDASTGSAIELVFVDERLSSFDAEQQLNDRKRAGEHLTRKRRKEQLDAVAAAGFLQSFLDGRLPAVDVDTEQMPRR